MTGIHLSDNMNTMRLRLPIGRTGDIIERKTKIGGKDACFYFVDGLIDGATAERLLDFLISISPSEMSKYKTAQEFIDGHFPYVEISLFNRFDDITYYVLAGQICFFIDGYSDAIVIDLREYPARSVSEPEKEKTLRGARDGFVETIIANTALIRRRVRDPGLVFETTTVGKRSKTDVAVGYIEGLCDEKLLAKVKKEIKNLDIDSISMGQESMLELIFPKFGINPFPKVRYTERPDVAAANIMEGKIIVIVDNTPSCIILPTSFFDFVQQVEDFYFPPVVGGYIRIVRNLFFYMTAILLPLWLWYVNNPSLIPSWLSVIDIEESYKIPIVVQLLILEFAIDGLRIASVNTPDSLSSSLGIIGALILSEFAIKTGWFVSETILYISVVALAAFAQPSMELTYAMKFVRMILLLLTQFFGLYGLVAGWVGAILLIASTKTLGGHGYLYPLIPFNKKDFKKVFLRQRLKKDSQNVQ